MTAKTYRGAKRVPDDLIRAGQLKETTPTKKICPPRLLGIGRGADNPTSVKNIVTKSKEVKPARYENIRGQEMEEVALDGDEWTKLLKKARAHQGLSSR